MVLSVNHIFESQEEIDVNPNTYLSGFFNEVDKADAARQLHFHHTLDRLDAFLHEVPLLASAPAIASAIGGGRYRVKEELEHVAISGEVNDARITPPYDVQRHPDDPTMVVASQILAFTVSPRQPGGLAGLLQGGSRDKSGRRPKEAWARYYLLSLRFDGIQYHTAQDEDASVEEKAEHTDPQTVVTEVEEATGAEVFEATEADSESGLSFNFKRFRPQPPLESYKLGIVRRGGEICLFSLLENENYGNTIPLMKGSGSVFSSDETPAEFGPVDRAYWRLQTIATNRDVTTLEVMADIGRLTQAFSLPQTPVRSGWLRRKQKNRK